MKIDISPLRGNNSVTDFHNNGIIKVPLIKNIATKLDSLIEKKNLALKVPINTNHLLIYFIYMCNMCFC